MRSRLESNMRTYSFIVLFFAEFTYYLLILQTGIVEYHHSMLSEIWMIPVGGILGIIGSVWLYKQTYWLMPVLLTLQLLLSFHYTDLNALELFILGGISGITAPMLIFHIRHLWIGVIGLSFAYTAGTLLFNIDAAERIGVAVGLSLVALLMSFMTRYVKEETKSYESDITTVYSMGSIFAWLLLDAILFETLSRDGAMHLWGVSEYTLPIVFFHIVGLVVAFYLRNWKHNDVVLLVLFAVTYGLYVSHARMELSILYPFVISYYNVIILSRLIKLGYALLAMMSLSLWAASGMGLFSALSGNFILAWIVLFVLFVAWSMRTASFKPACRVLDASI